MAFCDFCDCENCKSGIISYDIGSGVRELKLYHAKCDDNKWICEVCYLYDLCISGPNKNVDEPCKDKKCSHRPKLISDFSY